MIPWCSACSGLCVCSFGSALSMSSACFRPTESTERSLPTRRASASISASARFETTSSSGSFESSLYLFCSTWTHSQNPLGLRFGCHAIIQTHLLPLLWTAVKARTLASTAICLAEAKSFLATATLESASTLLARASRFSLSISRCTSTTCLCAASASVSAIAARCSSLSARSCTSPATRRRRCRSFCAERAFCSAIAAAALARTLSDASSFALLKSSSASARSSKACVRDLSAFPCSW